MPTDAKTIAFIVDQTAGAGAVTARKMFGEYGLFCNGRMVAIIGDDQLLVKPTPGGRAFAGEVAQASPYPGAKPYLLIDPERWEDGDWLTELIRISAAEIPLPKEKTKRSSKPR